MDISGIANLATAMSNARTEQAVGIAVLKKAIDLEAAGALALIEALPDISATQNLPAHLGQRINTTA
ncbi:MAG: YjfB family protein [Nitrosomonas sp.]|nr:MAG: YjfB family protein [Nitrosomonas sp.]